MNVRDKHMHLYNMLIMDQGKCRLSILIRAKWDVPEYVRLQYYTNIRSPASHLHEYGASQKNSLLIA